LYDRPANLFVAEFIGSPEMNLYEATVAEDKLVIGSQRLSLGPAGTALAPHRGRKGIAGVRPEDLGLDGDDDRKGDGAGQAGQETLAADVRMVEGLGSELHVFFSIDAPAAGASMRAAAAGEGEEGLIAGDTHNGIARVGPRTAVRPGQRVTFRVDTA